MLTDVTLGMLAQLNDESDMQRNHQDCYPGGRSIILEQELSNHPMLIKLIRTSVLCIWSCEYSLIVLWPQTDECDRTAKRAEGDKSHRTNTLEQFKTKAVGVGVGDILNCLPLPCLVALRSTVTKSKLTNDCLFQKRYCVFKCLQGPFHRYYRIFVIDSKHIFK